MRIDSSTVGMESARSYKASNVTVRRFTIKEYQGTLTQDNPQLQNFEGSHAEESEDRTGTHEKSGAHETTNATLQDLQNQMKTGSSNVKMRNTAEQTYNDIRQLTVRYIFQMLLAARRNKLREWSEENGYRNNQVSQTDIDNLCKDNNDTQIMPVQNFRIRMLNYSQETYYEERESVDFSTTGTVKTADGREISFQVNVGMSREFKQYYKEDLNFAAFKMCDPLVINLDTDVASLSDQTFYFDIDADGEEDEISGLNRGSGYLALDRNGDGVINDGSELFGTKSGNGFEDLAAFDEDGNGWIDENDSIWSKLKIWTKDENGNDLLYSLTEKDIGAICLNNVSTDFEQKDVTGQTRGAIRSTGVFLYENGNVGTVQHLDVAKFYKEA